MSRRLLSSCLAALAFAGCTQQPQLAPLRPPPVIPSKATVAVGEPVRDAGLFVAPPAELTAALEARDPIGLQHTSPTVDHLSRARALKEEADLGGALTEARRHVFSQPEDIEGLRLVASLAKAARQRTLAADALGRLCELTPDDAVPCVQEARARLEAKDPLGAIEAGQRAISRDSGNPEGWHVVGRAQLSQGNLKDAIAYLEKTVALSPSNGYALNNLGFALLRANENTRALEALELAVEALPSVAYVHNNLGVAYERTGKLDEAKAAFSAATALSPKYVKARVNQDRVAKLRLPTESEVDLEPGLEGDALHPTPEQR